jgi:hypothetical protein
VTAGLISLGAAARAHDHNGGMLRAAVDAGLFRYAERRETAKGRVSIQFRESDFLEDQAALPKCHECGAPTLRKSGFCQVHEEQLLPLGIAGQRHGQPDLKALGARSTATGSVS